MNKKNIITLVTIILLSPCLILGEQKIDSLLNYTTPAGDKLYSTFEDYVDITIPPFSLLKKVIKIDLLLPKNTDPFAYSYCRRPKNTSLTILSTNIRKSAVDSIKTIFLNNDNYGCQYYVFPSSRPVNRKLNFFRKELYRMYTDNGDTLDVICDAYNDDLLFIYNDNNEMICERIRLNAYSDGARQIISLSNSIVSFFNDSLPEVELKEKIDLLDKYLFDENMHREYYHSSIGCVKIIGGEDGIKISNSNEQLKNIEIKPILNTKKQISRLYNNYIENKIRINGEFDVQLIVNSKGNIIKCKKVSEELLDESFESDILKIMSGLVFQTDSTMTDTFKIDIPFRFRCK